MSEWDLMKAEEEIERLRRENLRLLESAEEAHLVLLKECDEVERLRKENDELQKKLAEEMIAVAFRLPSGPAGNQRPK